MYVIMYDFSVKNHDEHDTDRSSRNFLSVCRILGGFSPISTIFEEFSWYFRQYYF